MSKRADSASAPTSGQPEPRGRPPRAARAALESAPTLAGVSGSDGVPVSGTPAITAEQALLATLAPADAPAPDSSSPAAEGNEARVHVREAVEPGLPPRVGRYLVLRQLGAGGMGVVYSAYDPELDRKVAVKVLRDSPQHRSLGRARVVQEAQAMARVSHPNVVHVYEVGEDPSSQEGRVFIAMEFVPGTSLASYQDSHPLSDPASLDTRLRLYLQAASGLSAAHACGLIHRGPIRAQKASRDRDLKAAEKCPGKLRKIRDLGPILDGSEPCFAFLATPCGASL